MNVEQQRARQPGRGRPGASKGASEQGGAREAGSLAPVSLARVIAASRSGAKVPAESSGYLALALADLLVRAPRDFDEPSVVLTLEGTVALQASMAVPTSSLASEAHVERKVRAVLAALLESAPAGTPALRAIARHRSTGSLEALIGELEGALIPVNRAAGRRALARLARETAMLPVAADVARPAHVHGSALPPPAPRPLVEARRAPEPPRESPRVIAPAPAPAPPAPSSPAAAAPGPVARAVPAPPHRAPIVCDVPSLEPPLAAAYAIPSLLPPRVEPSPSASSLPLLELPCHDEPDVDVDLDVDMSCTELHAPTFVDDHTLADPSLALVHQHSPAPARAIARPAAARPAVEQPSAPGPRGVMALSTGAPRSVEALLESFAPAEGPSEIAVSRALRAFVGVEPTALPPSVCEVAEPPTDDPTSPSPSPTPGDGKRALMPTDPLMRRPPRAPRTAMGIMITLLLLAIAATIYVWVEHPSFFRG